MTKRAREELAHHGKQMHDAHRAALRWERAAEKAAPGSFRQIELTAKAEACHRAVLRSFERSQRVALERE